MLKKKTCLLLGAGASRHLRVSGGGRIPHFPSGDELTELMLDGLQGMVNRKTNEGDKESADFFKKMLNELGHGYWPSPDKFLEAKPLYAVHGKRLICEILVNREIQADLMRGTGWYKELLSAIATSDPNDLKKNQLSIVTFNYDRTIDALLHKYVEHQFDLGSDEAFRICRDAFPIVHVHGMLGEYPKWGLEANSNVMERANYIKIISEVEDATVEFKMANKYLNEADQIVVCGFGFGDDNVRRLGFFRECAIEDRKEITIAAGLVKGEVHRKARLEWMARWGLHPDLHYFDTTMEQMLFDRKNPFT